LFETRYVNKKEDGRNERHIGTRARGHNSRDRAGHVHETITRNISNKASVKI